MKTPKKKKKTRNKSNEPLHVLFKRLREGTCLKQDELGVLLAYHTGREHPITQGSVSKIERGVLQITPSLFSAYLKIFKIDSSDFKSSEVEENTKSPLRLN